MSTSPLPRWVLGLVPLGFGLALTTLGAARAWLREPLAPTPTQATGIVFQDRNGNRVRDAGEDGLAGVRVSNQLDIAITDAQGRWTLPVRGEDTTFFVLKPRGWRSPVNSLQIPQFFYTHKPAGSPKQRFPGVAPTGPLPASIDFPLIEKPEPDKFQALYFGDTQPRNVQEVDFMRHDILEELVGTEALFGTTLGDIVFDDLSVLEPHNQAIALLGIPWHNVLGNHDMNYDSPDDRHSDETFERHFGPNYFAFDYGQVHFLALDNVHWAGASGGKEGAYHGELGSEQLEFVKRDLEAVPPDKLVVALMHIPLAELRDREAFFRLLEPRPHAISVAAHMHTQTHYFYGEQDGWRGAKPHHHLVNVTVCGSWWGGLPDERGIPHATMADGAPNGYSIFTFDGNRYSIEFKAAGRPASYQMEIGAPEETGADDGAEVTVNVFAGSERSVVEMRVGAGDWKPLERVARADPSFLRLKQLEAAIKPPVPGVALPKPQICPHLWSGKLPRKLPEGDQWIEVRTRDAFGQVYSSRRALRVRQ